MNRPIPYFRDKNRFWSRVARRHPDKCWLWIARCNNGYGQFCIDGHNYRAHRVAYKLARRDPGAFHVLHACDTPRCCNPRHLVRGTHDENSQHCVRRGRKVRGSAHPSAKLTATKVRAILRSEASGAALASKYGVSGALISRIRNGKAWKHVDGLRRTTRCGPTVTDALVREYMNSDATQAECANAIGVSLSTFRRAWSRYKEQHFPC